jgi:hypothetical protein
VRSLCLAFFDFPSKESLIAGAAYASLALTVIHALWPKFTAVVFMVAESFAEGARWLRRLVAELRAKDRLPRQT